MAPPEFVSTEQFPPVPSVKERPILFSAPMVRALRDGSKTQTRRVAGLEVINADPDRYEFRGTTSGPGVPHFAFHDRESGAQVLVPCRHGQSGDRLWVREAWSTHAYFDHLAPRDCPKSIHYTADGKVQTGKGRPSIHMPRWASRIDLEIVDVRVERLQDISEADADAEGCERLDSEREVHDWKLCPQCGGTRLYTSFGPNMGACFDTDCMDCDTYVKRYRHLWETINGAGSWDTNSWVWVVEFRRVRPCQ